MKQVQVLTIMGMLLAPPVLVAEEGTPGVSYEVDVDLVLLDAVVLDRQGQPVGGLLQEDFELYEDGELQEITSFSEEKFRVSTEEGPTLVHRWFVLVFHETMRPPDLARSRQAALEFVESEIDPSDRVAVLNYGSSLQLVCDFTSDVDRLKEALSVGSRGSLSQPVATPISDDEGPRFGNAGPDLAAIQNVADNQRFYEAMTVVSQVLARIRGRKNLVLFSSGFPGFDDTGASPATRR